MSGNNNLTIINKIIDIRDEMNIIISEYIDDNVENVRSEINESYAKEDNKFNNVAISLDNIDELFDDFDDNPEVYETRTLSDDFIDVIKSRYRDSLKKLHIILVVPESQSIKELEDIIIQRIKDQLKFKMRDQRRKVLRKLLIAIGYFVIGIATLINFPILKGIFTKLFINSSVISNEIILIIGWVGIWESITTFVDCFNDELRDYFFVSKIQKALFSIRYY